MTGSGLRSMTSSVASSWASGAALPAARDIGQHVEVIAAGESAIALPPEDQAPHALRSARAHSALRPTRSASVRAFRRAGYESDSSRTEPRSRERIRRSGTATR